jgi:hypothetical protein
MAYFDVGTSHFGIAHPWWYLLSFLGATVEIRVILCTLRTLQVYKGVPRQFYRVLGWDIIGLAAVARTRDNLIPAFLGFIELALYPMLIATAAWTPIGGWLALKAAASWRWEPARDGHAYMRFLLGNALAIFFSALLALMVSVRS